MRLRGPLAIGNEPGFDPLVQDGRDLSRHREVVTVVVGVLRESLAVPFVLQSSEGVFDA
jgi:hypothetical protein